MKKPDLTMKQNLLADKTGETKKWHGLLDCARIASGLLFIYNSKKKQLFQKLYLFSVLSINRRIAPITRSAKPCFSSRIRFDGGWLETS